MSEARWHLFLCNTIQRQGDESSQPGLSALSRGEWVKRGYSKVENEGKANKWSLQIVIPTFPGFTTSQVHATYIIPVKPHNIFLRYYYPHFTGEEIKAKVLQPVNYRYSIQTHVCLTLECELKKEEGKSHNSAI